jgi:hypothetical protein
VSTPRAIAFWLFVYLAFSPLLSSALVFVGHAPNFPVFDTFQSAPAIWRIAFLLSGLTATLTAYLLHRNKKAASLSAAAFLVLFIPSFRVVWGQIAFGVWIAIAATVLAIFVALKTRNEV